MDFGCIVGVFLFIFILLGSFGLLLQGLEYLWKNLENITVILKSIIGLIVFIMALGLFVGIAYWFYLIAAWMFKWIVKNIGVYIAWAAFIYLIYIFICDMPSPKDWDFSYFQEK